MYFGCYHILRLLLVYGSADFLDKAADDDLDDAEYAVGTAGTEARGQPDQIDNGLGGVMDPIGGWAGRLWQPPGGN